MHYMTLDVQTKGQHTDMKFLITDVGSEDMVLGYPWLAQYEPKVNWRNTTLGNDCHEPMSSFVTIQSHSEVVT